ncbi:Uncharacterised protein [Mycobacteroides abscessus subsp. abscessus]|nr:Uncharacterised protein [Mycobacteroides abscessus subsp. abscessus]
MRLGLRQLAHGTGRHRPAVRRWVGRVADFGGHRGEIDGGGIELLAGVGLGRFDLAGCVGFRGRLVVGNPSRYAELVDPRVERGAQSDAVHIVAAQPTPVIRVQRPGNHHICGGVDRGNGCRQATDAGADAQHVNFCVPIQPEIPELSGSDLQQSDNQGSISPFGYFTYSRNERHQQRPTLWHP